ncbi:hypothetical protein [Nonomuraea jabiensis]|uniref:RNA polymerase sigma factor 70 region 4 type 2 domain-containing protein n=1 Tax=Nonomuraea jabiensis TaxID=882448 RepID=A0A7W9G4B0_9ACTN|nr:hypothetical protein [Nonomuraea jabiensis]MBB5776933.1 hypothetical protein [Nonomuraea jabiensis]
MTNVGPQESHGDTPTATYQRTKALNAHYVGFAGREYFPVVGFLIWLGATMEEGKAAAQEAFDKGLKLLLQEPSSWERITDQSCWVRLEAVSAWLRMPGRHPHRQALAPLADEREPDPPGDELAGLMGLTSRVLSAIRKLPFEQRLTMAFSVCGLPDSYAARALGMSEHESAVIREEARTMLKRELSGHRREQVSE